MLEKSRHAVQVIINTLSKIGGCSLVLLLPSTLRRPGIGAAFKLGRYLGLEGKGEESDELPRVIIYDGCKTDKLP